MSFASLTISGAHVAVLTLQVRTKEEQNITLITPYYDIVRAKMEESDEEEAEEVARSAELQRPSLSPSPRPRPRS
jgi:hypothetical protein